MSNRKRNAWSLFKADRAEMIHAMTAEGMAPAGIAGTLSCDPTQVRLISMTPLRSIPDTEEWLAERKELKGTTG